MSRRSTSSKSGASSLQIEADRLRAERNAHAKAVGMAKGRGEDIAPLIAKGDALTRRSGARRARLAEVQAQLERWQLELPNLLHESVPEGADETANVKCAAGASRASSPSSRATTSSSARSSAGFRGGRPDLGRALRGDACADSRGCIARSRSSCWICTRASMATRKCMCRISCRRDALIGTGQLPKFEQDLFSDRRRAGAFPDPDRGSAGDESRARPDRRAPRICR